jgi:hypothetical protein
MSRMATSSKRSTAQRSTSSSGNFVDNDGGLAVVRIKPLGAGGGGGERSAASGRAALHAVKGEGVRVGGGRNKVWTYPQHVIAPERSQHDLYEKFVPQRIEQFLAGYPVNICCYGQTGSGKTHTMFGPPGLMARAAANEFGDSVCPDYGLFPRGLLNIVSGLREKKHSGGTLQYYLTASAVELSMISGNVDMFVKSGSVSGGSKSGVQFSSSANGVCIDKTTKPPLLYGMVEVEIDPDNPLHGTLALFAAIASRNTAATGMNDSSSRSHCFVWLTLHAYDVATDSVRVSRFQFADLAGSERINDAHVGFSGAMNAMASGDMGAIQGMVTNYGLMILSQRVREVRPVGFCATCRRVGVVCCDLPLTLWVILWVTLWTTRLTCGPFFLCSTCWRTVGLDGQAWQKHGGVGGTELQNAIGPGLGGAVVRIIDGRGTLARHRVRVRRRCKRESVGERTGFWQSFQWTEGVPKKISVH